MATLTAEQLERAKKAFRSLDANGDGRVTVKEFSEALKPYLTDTSLAALMKEVNPNGNSFISWKEFLEDYRKDL
ncbi:EF-hand domain-containing protein [Pseudomonas abietaniphila]|uniref:EF-hand domain-containing protein n=1 Tax=Pseudomonas abietaniphila TaxID=89065 RepID=UPI000781C2D2|nr:EF-hand domain-containing protein [Pseudomonas abietaniphila]